MKQSKLRQRRGRSEGLAEMDDTVLFLTRPYGIAAAVCWFLSLFCILILWEDKQSSAFLLSVITISVDTVLLLVLVLRAKIIGVRNKKM